jgi:hypothetical protein
MSEAPLAAPTPEVPAVDAASPRCAAFCAKLAALGCPEGDQDHAAACAAVCAQEDGTGSAFDVAVGCVVGAPATLDGVRACRVRCAR